MIEESDLLRFIEGECTPEEAAAIQNWLAADPKRVEKLDELRAVWSRTGDAARPWDKPAARARLERARAARPRLTLVPRTIEAPGWVSSWRLRIAVALSAAAVFWLLRPPAPDFRDYATAPGQLADLTLPDSSRVLLSVDSRLRVPRGYGAHERAVELEGEAYFVVRHVAGRPFLVRTRHGVVEDLGTEFDVRAYGQDDRLEVVVAAGRVALRDTRRVDSVLLTLEARDRGVIDSGGATTRTRGVRVEDYIGWIRGRLVFDDAPLAVVVAQIERWYGIDVELDDSSLQRERLTISFTTESMDEALEAVALVLDVRVVRTGEAVRFVRDHSR